MTSATPGIDALKSMRSVRRRHRVAELEWFESLYRVYLAAFVGGGAILVLSGLVGDSAIDGGSLDTLVRRIPHVVGLVTALVVFLGLRSGANGGPIAVEEPEVRHVLLSPIPHSAVLRHPAIQRIRTFAFAGAIAGGTANQLLERRIPSAAANLVVFALWGALAGAIIGALFVVSALIAHGTGAPRWSMTALGSVLVGWQAWVTVSDSHTAGPFDFVGSLSMWWHRISTIDLVGVAAVVVLTAFAIKLAGDLSLEALARRSSLVSQLKFAVTLQDIRTVMLLRRQLSQEHMRARPWVKVPRLLRRDPVVGRGFRSIAHFPARRLARMLLLSVAASVALVWAWRGTTPGVLVAGLLLFVMGLDAVEPLSQEVDQPDRTDSIPMERGLLLAKHLTVPAIITLPFTAIGTAVAYALEPHGMTLVAGALIGIPASMAGLAGAVINAVKGAPDPASEANAGLFMPPEVSGMTTVIRAVWPPVVSIIGSVPVVALVSAVERNQNVPGTMVRTALGVFSVCFLTAGWVRQRDHIRAWFRNATRPPSSSSGSTNNTSTSPSAQKA